MVVAAIQATAIEVSPRTACSGRQPVMEPVDLVLVVSGLNRKISRQHGAASPLVCLDTVGDLSGDVPTLLLVDVVLVQPRRRPGICRCKASYDGGASFG